MDHDINKVKEIALDKLKDIWGELEQDFNETVEESKLYFLKGFPLHSYINLNDAINGLVYDHDQSNSNTSVFTNYVGMKTVSPIFRFHNGTMMQAPLVRLNINEDKNENIKSLIINISINFISIPASEQYYIENGTDKFVYTFSKSFDLL